MAASAKRCEGISLTVYALQCQTRIFDTSGTIQMHRWIPGPDFVCCYYVDRKTAEIALNVLTGKCQEFNPLFPELESSLIGTRGFMKIEYKTTREYEVVGHAIVNVPALLFAGKYYHFDYGSNIGPSIQTQRSFHERATITGNSC